MGWPKPWTDEQRKAAGDRLVYLKRFDLHGPVDVALRLLEQGEITRSKAREAIRAIAADQAEQPLPLDKLDWNPAPASSGAGKDGT
jgi:hypothetical protein